MDSGDSLRRVRVRLTTWYAATFAAILLVLGTGMFATITWRYDRELDESLRDTAHELMRVVQARDGVDHLFDASEFRVPDRLLYVTSGAGHVLAGPAMPEWLAEVARAAARTGPAQAAHDMASPSADSVRLVRAYAEAVRLPRGDSVVVVAAADEVEIEDRYAALIATFSIAALAGVVLVTAGGWFLGRQSAVPIERLISHMRRFMADAAHELRTPLTILRSRAEVTLQRPREPADYVVALQAVERESSRLGRIVEDLLMLARADAGERPTERRRVFLDDIVFDAVETARVVAEGRSVCLGVGELPETPVDGDGSLLRQLVIILLDNAIKYTPPGGTIRVDLSKASGMATVIVADTGIGIAPEHLPFVFDRFYRADPARARDDAGTAPTTSQGVGLGLAIARWIAEQHEARVSIISGVASGTTVSVVFPLSASAATA